MKVEAVVLTGGASRRMGQDKAKVEVDGIPMGERIVQSLRQRDLKVTVIGRERIEDAEFLEDEEEFAGPLVAIARFQPTADFVFAASCDLPFFDASIVEALKSQIDGKQVAIPKVADRRQPLCALYRRESFAAAAEALKEGKRSITAWLDRLDVQDVNEKCLTDAGIDPASVLGVNTPAELVEALRIKSART